jgi:membrane associated rhomboid family serine protease
MSLEHISEERDQSGSEPTAGRVAYRIPIPRYTVTLLICIAAVFAVQLWVDDFNPGTLTDLLFHELKTSVLLAGFVKPSFFHGEYWLILTGAFLHGFLVHAAMNSYAFYSFGKLFELLTNRAHVPIVFLFSAVGGGLLSAFFIPDGISVGASGGIVGLIGYLLIYAFRRRQFVSAEFRKSLLMNIGFILVFGLVLFRVVDNWGHIGGLLAGAIYGLVQIPSDEYKNPQDAGTFTQIMGLVALGICIVTAGFSIYLMLRG